MWHGRQGVLACNQVLATHGGPLLSELLVPCAQDANYELFLATDPSVADARGGYYVSNRKSRMGQAAQDKATRQRFWELLEQQSGQHF